MAIVIVLALALGLYVVQQTLDEIIPFRVPAALTRMLAIALGAGLAWTLGYSVFAAFGQELRAEWMHPVFTGVVLVAIGEFLRTLMGAFISESGEPAREVASITEVQAA